MIAVIFEADPHEDQQAAYLEAEAILRPRLDTLPGFISIERFESLTTPGRLLLLSNASSRTTACESPPCCTTTG
jgi:heme-degrading monooxygenase HmoA